MDTIMGAQEHLALARSLFDLYNSRQSDPAWLDKSMAAFAADASVLGSSSTHEALGRTAVLFSFRVQEWEDRQSPQLLRYDDPAGTTRSGSCNGTGDAVTAQARFSRLYEELGGELCALTHITSAAESLWYLSGLDRLWYPMAKLVHQDSKSLDIVEL